ncbi:hypothetical protein ADICEAN_02060 [Cesiribacter andamanensis AMV16]|uniref:YqaE/Pmp3 family membrane protein n=1 Tax=Cesiribacter andamanensis AMV16 TaxID=1279009 RepID=M7NM03_9BACT|nr:hypothetical protein ADICEAN_02060 [Cesiribacter andamanensis AMV16]
MFFLAACSPEYGAHFAPSKQDAYAHAPKADKTEQLVAPLEATEINSPAPEVLKAQESGATDIVSDAETPAVAPAPAVEEISPAQQRKMLRQLREKVKGMSAEEKEAFKESVLNQLKEQQQNMRLAEADDFQRDGRAGSPSVSGVLLVIITILLPPLGVFLHQGEINAKFWISLLLTLLFYVPGLIYSLLVIFDVI